MEELLTIPTPDGKNIYGKLRSSLSKPLVIFVHGLGALMDQHIYYNGSRFLEKNGVSSFRFDLYGWEPDQRNLSTCTLANHSSDLDTVIDYFKTRGAKKIFVVGHSFGGPSTLLAKREGIAGIILWDPSYGYPFSLKGAKYVKELDAYVARWNFDVIISKEMIAEAETLTQREEAAIKEVHVPIKIINPDCSPLTLGGEKYFQMANEPKERIVIAGSGHTFDEDGAEEKLHAETLAWIKRFI